MTEREALIDMLDKGVEILIRKRGARFQIVALNENGTAFAEEVSADELFVFDGQAEDR